MQTFIDKQEVNLVMQAEKSPILTSHTLPSKCNASLSAESSTRWLLCEMGWSNPWGGVRIKYYTDRLILHSKNRSMLLYCQNNITITSNKTKNYSWISLPDLFSVPKIYPECASHPCCVPQCLFGDALTYRMVFY